CPLSAPAVGDVQHGSDDGPAEVRIKLVCSYVPGKGRFRSAQTFPVHVQRRALCAGPVRDVYLGRHRSRWRVHLHRGDQPRNWIIDMSTPFIGEIKMFGGSFAPLGWTFCNGSLLPIAQYDALFSLIGTTYGGDGEVTFQLPDLRGRFPIHQGTSPATGTTFAIG